MKKIRLSIMTNKTYPSYKVVNYEMFVDENKKSYSWEYQAIKDTFQDSDDEYPVGYEIEEVK